MWTMKNYGKQTILYNVEQTSAAGKMVESQ